MNRVRRWSSIFIFALTLLACGQTAPTPSPTLTPPTLQPRINNPRFAFGVEYILPGLAQSFAQTGARSTRFAGGTFSWREIEPDAPRTPGQHVYRWDKVDRLVVEYQSAGFDQIQIYTTAWNDWASSRPKNDFPDARYLDDYEAYMFNLVTRYSGDMPGLEYPILDYVVEREWTEFFPGTTDEYLQLLTIAQRAIKRANPNARVWLVPLMMIDVFDGNPSANDIATRARINRSFRHPIAEAQKLLAHPELFDVIEIHALGDYAELPATMQWLQAEMARHKYTKPVFVGDALGMSQMIWLQNPRGLTANATDADFLTFAPIRTNDALRVIALLDAIKDARAPEHESATRWLRAEHAKALVKKFVAAMDAGYVGMNMWALADLPLLQQPRVTSNWFFMGMLDAQAGPTWIPGTPRPAYYALKQTIDALANFSHSEKLNLGQNIVAYRVTVRGKPVVVAWHEPGRLYFPGESEPTIRASIPITTTRVIVTRTSTEIGKRPVAGETLTPVNGTLTLTLDSTPVFIEPGN